MKKIIGFIICTLLITATGLSVAEIDENRENYNKNNTTSNLEYSPPLTGLFEWPKFHHDPHHTGYSISLGPENDDILWSTTMREWVSTASSPTVAGEKVYASSMDIDGSYFYCFDAFTGEELWMYEVSDELICPTISDGWVYILGDYYALYCLDADTGALIWTYPIYGGNSPTIVDGKVYVGNYGGGIYCLNATTGDLIWTFDDTTDYQMCSPAVANGKVYIGSGPYNQPGTLYCLDAETGDEIWNYLIPGSNLVSSPTVFNDKVYIADAQLHCFNATSGDEEWVVPEIYTDSSPAVAYGSVFIQGYYGFYAFDANTGDPVWSYLDDYGETWSSLAVADEKIYAVGEGKFLCLDAFTGVKLWDYSPLSTTTSPAVAYGNLYISNGNSELFVFGTPNESPEKPSKPDGSSEGIVGVEYTFNTSTTDPEGDDVYYLFDWGDGTNSGWQGGTLCFRSNC